MGEIADGLINGDFDFYTGEYIGRGHGMPRTFSRSLPWEKKDFTRSEIGAFKGVKKYLFQKLKITDITSIVNEYIPGNESIKKKCLTIQKDWKKFMDWVSKKKLT